MIWFRRLGCVAIWAVSVSVVSGSQFPIQAFVQQPALLRGGPGEQFYETQELVPGSVVQIYKVTDDGWCGIRPLDNSYSLIPVNAVEDASRKTSKINQSGVRTRIGSHMHDQVHVKYVTLHPGEPVKIMGHSSDGAWLRISPPSGEFRWIHRQFLGSQKPTSVAKQSTPENRSNQAVQTASYESASNDQPSQSEPREAADRNAVGSSIRASGQEVPPLLGVELQNDAKSLASQSPPDANGGMKTIPMEPIEKTPPSDVEPVEQSASAAEGAWTVRNSTEVPQLQDAHSTIQTPEPTLNGSAKKFYAELKQINVLLSSIVTKETSAWDFTEVRARAENVIDDANGAGDRQAARELLGRIAEFEALKRRFDGYSTSSIQQSTLAQHSPSRSTAALPSRSKTSTAERNRNVDRGQIDLVAFLESNNQSRQRESKQSLESGEPNSLAIGSGVGGQAMSGWLMPVVTTNKGLPQFALTDDDGQILCFVSGSAGLRLKPYVRQHVQISGEGLFSKKLQKRHLVATRIVASR